MANVIKGTAVDMLTKDIPRAITSYAHGENLEKVTLELAKEGVYDFVGNGIGEGLRSMKGIDGNDLKVWDADDSIDSGYAENIKAVDNVVEKQAEKSSSELIADTSPKTGYDPEDSLYEDIYAQQYESCPEYDQYIDEVTNPKKLDYQPTSGATLKANPDKTTTILGEFSEILMNSRLQVTSAGLSLRLLKMQTILLLFAVEELSVNADGTVGVPYPSGF